jgi:hypothetical protein
LEREKARDRGHDDEPRFRGSRVGAASPRSRILPRRRDDRSLSPPPRVRHSRSAPRVYNRLPRNLPPPMRRSASRSPSPPFRSREYNSRRGDSPPTRRRSVSPRSGRRSPSPPVRRGSVIAAPKQDYRDGSASPRDTIPRPRSRSRSLSREPRSVSRHGTTPPRGRAQSESSMSMSAGSSRSSSLSHK